KVDILKMDIEFAEYEVLFSATCKSIVQYDHLLIEIHEDEQHKARTLIRRLRELNFEIIAGNGNEGTDVYFFENRLRLQTANGSEDKENNQPRINTDVHG
ncbi:MAG TPA: FkbM family methyltransferase, partial [Chthoniobacterales bacterium]|nr:FkbM family methyltransferase [Chthoniobacterales bacterium]